MVPLTAKYESIGWHAHPDRMPIPINLPSKKGDISVRIRNLSKDLEAIAILGNFPNLSTGLSIKYAILNRRGIHRFVINIVNYVAQPSDGFHPSA